VSPSTTGDGARWIVRGAGFAIGALLVAGLVALAWLAASVLVLIFVALLIATAVEPWTDRLRDRLPTGRATTVMLAYGAFFAVLIGLGIIFVPVITDEAARVLARLPGALADAEAWAEQLQPKAASTVVVTLLQAAETALGGTLSADPDVVVSAGVAAAELVMGLGAALALAFFWLLERARIQRYALAFVPEPARADAREAWNTVTVRLGLWTRGQVTLMLAMGVATGFAYTLLGLPAALLLAVIAGVTEVIPIIGPLLGAIPAIAVAATVSTELAVVVAAVYVGLQVVEGFVLVPIVMRNAVGLSPFLILVSVLVGAAAGGILGALIAVPMVATLEIVIERFQERETPVAIDPVASTESSDPSVEEEATTAPA
jgi:predicted PurR-regulated permease PerM